MPFDATRPKKRGDYIFPHMARMDVPTGHVLVSVPVTTGWREILQVAKLHGSISMWRLTGLGVTFSYCFADGEQNLVGAREDSDVTQETDPPTIFVQGVGTGIVIFECWYFEDQESGGLP